jgi:hypothetical protein
MQHLNDDMDELFRKAADDYPLNTRTPDWNKVAEGLSQDSTPAVPVKKSYRRYRWLWLLLPLGFMISEISDPGMLKRLVSGNKTPMNTDISQKSISETDEQGAEQKAVATTNAEGSETGVPAGKSIAGSDTELLKSGNGEDASNNEEGKNAGNHEADADITKLVDGNEASDLEKRDLSSDPKRRSMSDKLSSSKKGNNRSGPGIAVTGASATVLAAGERTSNDPFKDKNNGKNTKGKTAGTEISGSEANENSEISPYTKVGLVAFDISPDPDLIAMPGMTTLKPGPVTKPKNKSKKFYVGGIGGLDLTTVNFQQTSDIGYHFGGMAGYSFARKWSVEVGFFVEKKYYYSDGKYFDKSGLNLGSNTTVVSVDGACKMFEIPFSVKYDISNTYKSNFFVTGGFSSYIMKKEEYEMVYQYGSGSRGTHYYPYENSSKNFFAEIRLTGGYAIKLPQHFSLRIEPYLNIPVTGVGYGKLNLMSAGLNAGVFKRIF